MKFTGIAVAIGIFILTFNYAYVWGESQKLIEERASSDVFARIDLEDFQGQKFTMDDAAQSKLVAYNIWETTCPACLGEMGELEKLSKEYDPSQFRLVGMCADLYDRNDKLKPEQLDKAKGLMKDAGVTFPNLIPDPEIMDFIHSTVVGYPTTVFVDGEGRIIDATAGARDLNGWKEYVNNELEKVQ